MYNIINIHHKTLNNCLNLGKLYLDTFFLSLDQIKETTKYNIMSIDKIKALINDKRKVYKVKHQELKLF